MCIPLAAAAIIMTVAGGAVAAYGQHKQGEYQQDVANYNAKVGEQQAQMAEEAGVTAEQQQRTRVRQIMGAQRAAMAGSGAVVDSGSFGNILDDTAKTGELDALTIRSNAARQAWGYRTGAEITRAEGAMAKSAGNYAAMGTLLTTAGNTFGMASKIKKG